MEDYSKEIQGELRLLALKVKVGILDSDLVTITNLTSDRDRVSFN